MKTAISIPDEVFKSAEAMAKRLGMSRSQFYTVAVNEYLKRNQDNRVTSLLNSLYAEENSALPSGVLEVQSQSLPHEEW